MKRKNIGVHFVVSLVVTLPALQATLSGADTLNNSPQAKTNASAKSHLRQQFTTYFHDWHHDFDGLLRVNEVNAIIKNPQARGDEAAAAVVIRRFIANNQKTSGIGGISLDQLGQFAEAPGTLQNFLRVRDQIANIARTVNQTLFLPTDPSLASFHQGEMADCYFLAVVGALVARDGTAMRTRFTAAGAGWRVHFRNGKEAVVPYLTDAELILGARLSTNHGIWLSVLEKAYATLFARASGPAVSADVIGGGGHPAPVIELFTGHRATAIPFFRKGVGDTADKAIERAREFLTIISREKLLTVVERYAPPGTKPAAIPVKHAFTVLGYDAPKQTVTVFDPRGHNFIPRGQPGRVNGYPVHEGVFEVPLDEFIHVFTVISYETTVPLAHP
jgi:hypothetical protein